jgi:hypothetical protein
VAERTIPNAGPDKKALQMMIQAGQTAAVSLVAPWWHEDTSEGEADPSTPAQVASELEGGSR